MTDKLPAGLLAAREAGDLIPFVGAGVSMAVRRQGGGGAFPSWIRLLESAAEQLEGERRAEAALVRAFLGQDEPDTLEAARYAQKGLRGQWSGFLSGVFNVSRGEIDEATLELGRAVWSVGSELVITTNYDRVLRWCCPQADDLTEWSIASPGGQVDALKGRLSGPTVWHLHGSLADTTQIILSPDGYAKLYPSDERAGAVVHKGALEALRQLMVAKTFLFVGFSMADPYLKRQLQWVEDTFAGCGGPHYVVGREAELETLRANIGGLDLQPVCVEGYADIPVLLRSLGGETEPPPSTAVSEPMVEKLVFERRLSPNLKEGDVVAGRYELVERGGDGGFATVWRARERERDCEVAVKVLHGQWFDKPMRVDRFRRGAQAMRRLEHEGIVEVLEAPALDGHHHFFVMPWRAGGDLRRARLGGLERDAALGAVADALEGLAHAHELGLVHRDVKPSNILLDGEGGGAIADFDLVAGMESTQGTRTSAGMGTVAYAAPELFDDAANADARADLYGAAMCVLFALTKGDPPWLVSLLKPRWLDEVPCGRRLRAALEGALATEKSARRGDCASLAAAVRAELVGDVISVAGPSIVVHGVELIRLEGGTFWMGTSLEDDQDYLNEHPRHEVTLSPFYLAKTPVTNGQYAKYLEANPRAPKPEYWADRRYNQPEQPVVGISWTEAKAYCDWAGLQLPTEAQWEYACRGGTETRYHSGNKEADLARVGWYENNSQNRLHTVAELEPNGFGLYDMHGNVWEWCQDAGLVSYETTPRAADGLRHAPESSDDGDRVVRGGGYFDDARFVRSAFSDACRVGFRGSDQGFRPAQVIP